MSKPKKSAANSTMPRRDPLASLKLADMMILKPVLPAEILATVVDYLAIPDLLRFARVSRRMQEMVYDDTRWVQRLKRMGCWDEAEARRRAEAPTRGDGLATTPGKRRQSILDRTVVNGKGRPEILFNADMSPAVPRRNSTLQTPSTTRADGFDFVQLSSPVPTKPASASEVDELATGAALSVLKRVRSFRGQARQEYGKVYQVLAPYYDDALSSHNPMDSLIFQRYSLPEQQAQMLAQVRKFARSDFSPGSAARERQLEEMMQRFDTSALLEFRQGYEYKDIQGRMRQYAHAMHTLNGGQSGVELFLHDNRLITQKAGLGSPSDCVDYSLGYGELSLERIQAYFERLGHAYSEETAVIQAVFPDPLEVSLLLLEKVGEEILSPFLSSLFEDARVRSTSMYLRIVSGTFAATRSFVLDFVVSTDADDATMSRCRAVAVGIYQPHLEPYLEAELASFKQKADAEVEQWDRVLSEQAASTENFLMSNVNRQADKTDFLSSFKKVVMMPVNMLPGFAGPSHHKTAAKALVNGDAADMSSVPSRSSTPTPLALPRPGTPSLPAEAPTSELAAKAAIMASNLENIRSLFSIEVALNLVHAAKSSLERVAQFMSLGGAAGESARVQSSTIFILLLHAVGVRHVKAGFDKAIDHLSRYHPRETGADDAQNLSSITVAPLVTFLELVNVGDLIQQMLDVFYESELVRLRISNRDDFLDAAVKEKKKFEAMLDERVATGLSKGIDVLMDEVEFICATTQQPSDFNPEGNAVVDIGPTLTAKRVIDVVAGHTSMLTGATEKTLLDVFIAELGLRLFTTLTKHIKRQRISTTGALPLLSDLSLYANFVASFHNHDLNSYFTALRALAQIYLIEGRSDKDLNEMATIISDGDRYKGVFTVEEVVEFAERRSDWLIIKNKVEGKVSGDGCALM